MSSSHLESSSSASPHFSDDETLHLALTFLSLPASNSSTLSPFPQPSPPQSERSSSSSSSTWLSPPAVETTCSRDEFPFPRRTSKRDNISRRGPMNLPNPPSPFGTQLEPETRSTPYRHTHHHPFFNPRPSPRALDVENDKLPRADPAEAYDTLLSAWISLKNIAGMWARNTAAVITQDGKKDLTLQLVKMGVGVVVICKPWWVLRTIDSAWTVVRDPWKVYRHTIYTFTIVKFLCL